MKLPAAASYAEVVLATKAESRRVFWRRRINTFSDSRLEIKKLNEYDYC
jgi:hypothetical protein